MKWFFGARRRRAEHLERERREREMRMREAAEIVERASALSAAACELEETAEAVYERSQAVVTRNHIGEMVTATLGYKKGRPA